jgi:opacity protein-like surface antigen
MMRALPCALTVAALFASASAAADEDTDARAAVPAHSSGVRLGMRYGVAVPIGQPFTDGGALRDSITGSVPFRIDAGYRFLRRFYLGANAQLAPIVPNGCTSGGSCSGSDLRVGAMAAVHILPDRIVDPWIGAGVGFERLSLSRTVDGASLDMKARGFELIDFELGTDCRVTRALRIGPVMSASLARYTSIEVNGSSTRDFDPALHAWVMLAIRGAYDL